ncbi:hydroxyethylthiazole kinase [Blautia sp. MSJ-19]|uniref:hydroxyethylthiazole kinase n=1 Tax=Blautia sp. MSJ-19 TaxID=2841517 RepID=UPI001C0F3735|nr:hydroxyethylthiazole kinase [Blautia sp. MSJ-19]MBU5480400.1 hydroxyethylthiazole kinase [Blautia sp. MSJ-19]
MPHNNNIEEISLYIHQHTPRIHCLTNPVTMQDVANILLAAGGSAVMGQNKEEAAEITSFCQGTLLNTGVPDTDKIQACISAGQKAEELGHPIVLDPVGVGASAFRKKELQKLLNAVHPTAIRCNQEEAVVLCSFLSDTASPQLHGGVESALLMTDEAVCQTALKTARLYNCTVLITGRRDVVSDGKRTQILTGGDSRIRRITGGGCMLSALCALFLCTDISAFDAVCAAGHLWRDVAFEAGRRTDLCHSGIGSFHVHLFDVLEEKIFRSQQETPL